MKNIHINKRNGQRYTDSVRDRNPAHEGKLAAGMWLASHIQGRNDISSIKNIKFSKNVLYDENLVLEENVERIGRGRDYVFKRGKEDVLTVTGVKMGEYNPHVKPLKEIQHIYDAESCPERVALFLKSIGFQPDVGTNPEMYLASLSAPALLHYGAQNDLVGVHASQTFNMHSPYKEGVIKVAMGDEKTKGPLHYFDLRWLQDEKIIASGRAGVVALTESELEEMLKELE